MRLVWYRYITALRRWGGLCGGLIALCTLAACESGIDPFVEEPETYFALYGFLDATADTQYVRVSPLRRALQADTDTVLADVTLEEVATGQRTVWQGRSYRLDDGTRGFEFFAAVSVAAGAHYRLEVRRPDGATTRAITRTPDHPNLATSAPEGFVALTQRVTWLGLRSRPSQVAMRYRVAPRKGVPPQEFVIPYQQQGVLRNEGWEFAVQLSQDRGEILRQLDRPHDDTTVVFYGLEMDIKRLSDEWAAPENPTNIEHGLGFFGAIGHYQRSWTLSDTTIADLGYTRPD